mgnify:FL=1
MISLHCLEEVHRLVAEGRLSLRQIAMTVGVSRKTVRKIALGQYRRPHPRPPGHEVAFSQGPLERCPRCGVKVYTPCLACYLRETQAARRRSPDKLLDEPLGLNLREEHRLRYEQIRSRIVEGTLGSGRE